MMIIGRKQHQTVQPRVLVAGSGLDCHPATPWSVSDDGTDSVYAAGLVAQMKLVHYCDRITLAV